MEKTKEVDTGCFCGMGLCTALLAGGCGQTAGDRWDKCGKHGKNQRG